MKHFVNVLKKAVCVAVSLCLSGTISAGELSGKSANEIARMIRVGWNLGNSFDATGNGANAETSWGNPRTTKEMFDKVKEAGFNAVRIPVSWHTHTNNNGQYQFAIDGQWMARVKEVVDYAYGNGMFVIINIHHDNERGYMFPTRQYLDQSKKYVSDIWSQVAKEFAAYDQHLIFETLNEPRVVGDQYEWYFDPSNPTQTIKEAIECVNQLNQVAVDAIRNAGGNNMDRLVGCPGYVASIDGVTTSGFSKPNDKANNRLWLSVHAYTPYDFCMNVNGSHSWQQKYYYDVEWLFNSLKSKFVDQGTPVYIGETSSSNYYNTEDRKSWERCFFGFSKNYGIPCFIWDNNTVNNPDGAERHGYLNRSTLQWFEPSLIQTIMEIVGYDPTTVVADVSGNECEVFVEGKSIRIRSNTAIHRADLLSVDGTKVAGGVSTGNECLLDVSRNGVYIAVVSTENGVSVKRFIVK